MRQGLLEYCFTRFEVCNISKLGIEGIYPWKTCYLCCVGVTHMLGDMRVAVNR